jgi:hypothetical protein
MVPTIFNSKTPISETELNAVETTFSIKLPFRYREFLLANNGGKPNPRLYRPNPNKYSAFLFEGTDSPDGDFLLDYFFSVGYGVEAVRFEWAFASFKIEHQWVPEYMTPIAMKLDGSLILIDLREDDEHGIYAWDWSRNEGDEPEVPGVFPNVYPIATNFDEFINGFEVSEWDD